MRMLEVFTSPETYEGNIDVVQKIWNFLIEKGYFHQMRVILEAKVPSSLEKSHHPPTPQAESIFSLIMNPIVFATNTGNKFYCDRVLRSLCQYLLCPAYSEQVEQFLLPAMVYSKYPFPFVDLIQTLIHQTSTNQNSSSPVRQGIVLSPWLLGSVVTCAEKHIESLSVADSVNLLLVLHNLLPQLPASSLDNADSDSDEDSMETEAYEASSPELRRLGEDCIQFLNSKKFVRCVVRCLQSKMDPLLVTSVCTICHTLIAQQNLSIHKLRLLYSLAFNREFIRSLWYTCCSVSNKTVTGSNVTLLQTLSRGMPMTPEDIQRIVPLLSVFCSMFSHSLYTLHDADFYGDISGMFHSVFCSMFSHSLYTLHDADFYGDISGMFYSVFCSMFSHSLNTLHDADFYADILGVFYPVFCSMFSHSLYTLHDADFYADISWMFPSVICSMFIHFLYTVHDADFYGDISGMFPSVFCSMFCHSLYALHDADFYGSISGMFPSVFCSMFSHSLYTLHDAEFYGSISGMFPSVFCSMFSYSLYTLHDADFYGSISGMFPSVFCSMFSHFLYTLHDADFDGDISGMFPSLFCSMFSHSLYTLHDADFYGSISGMFPSVFCSMFSHSRYTLMMLISMEISQVCSTLVFCSTFSHSLYTQHDADFDGDISWMFPSVFCSMFIHSLYTLHDADFYGSISGMFPSVFCYMFSHSLYALHDADFDGDISGMFPSLFCSMFSHFLYTLHDADFYGSISGMFPSVFCSMFSHSLYTLHDADFDGDISGMFYSVFCSTFSHSLYTLHDADFYGDISDKESSMPFRLREIVPMVLLLRDTCLGIIELAHPDAKLSVTEDYREALRRTAMKDRNSTWQEDKQELTTTWSHLFKVTATLVRQLYTRDSRQQFCPSGSWLSDRVHIQADKPSQIYRAQGSVFTRRPFGTMRTLTKVQIDDSGPPLSNTDVKNLVILTELPFVVSFTERVKILQKLIQNDRDENQGDAHNFLSGPAINVMIRRNYIYEDAFDKLSPENEPDLKKKMRVQLVNAAGLDEAGIDGGGIFREFLSELLKTGFDPNRGLFLMTTERLLYPNPQSVALMENYTQHYYFLGRMLGKRSQFATFFLSKILSRHSGDLDIHHLASLDPELYRNLLFLKTYEGDVSELGLDFTAVNNDFGQTKVEELKPGGRNIPVTNFNKIEYIHLMADYKINRQIRTHCIAFRRGMADLINLEWLRMFDHHELQTLISGALIPVNILDLKQHTNYSGGYNLEHPVIRNFWKVVENFTDQQKRKLLKFVTSCSRPPLLGFKDLYPAFCIHFGGSEADRLPTASTCMNLLKLPEFRDEETMKTKLLYAIESGAGFELS
ncbi:hypothetical protein FSP39_000528 [Pinctada imbricata]|uniref:HECT-type E3 ubiquitin transferase n=1 Tax=Pinctada imbricata TaxID=66713 RepID=A0AA89C014_PINIB|nr:hypothetical protein FSP39_000528 [Pinctada imbricata]